VPAKSGSVQGDRQKTVLAILFVVVAVGVAAAVIGRTIWVQYPHGASVVINATGQAPKLQAMRAMKAGAAGGGASDPTSAAQTTH
jgi:hypothetical protein